MTDTETTPATPETIPTPAPVETVPVVPESPVETTPATAPTIATLQATDLPLQGTPAHKDLIQRLEDYIHDGEEDIKVGAADIIAWLKKHL